MKTGGKQPGPGETRLCTEPWGAPAIRADGGVMRCCYGGIDFGTIGAGASLGEILNSDAARSARRQLLSGELDEICSACPRFPVVPVAEYRSFIDSVVNREAGAPIRDLSDAIVPATVWLELTSRCNLRCTYCHQSAPNWVNYDLPLAAIDAVLDALIELGVKQVSLTGRGESTLVRHWEEYAERLLDAGVKVAIITNLARPITDREARSFARMSDLCVSIDTVDRAIFKKLRTGDVRILLENVAKIMAEYAKYPNVDFRMRWSAVVSAEVAPGLLDLAATAVALGVSSVEFQCLIGDDSGVYDRPQTLDEMPAAVLTEVALAVWRAEQFLIARLGPEGVFVAPGLRSRIAEVLAGKSSGARLTSGYLETVRRRPEVPFSKVDREFVEWVARPRVLLGLLCRRVISGRDGVSEVVQRELSARGVGGALAVIVTWVGRTRFLLGLLRRYLFVGKSGVEGVLFRQLIADAPDYGTPMQPSRYLPVMPTAAE